MPSYEGPPPTVRSATSTLPGGRELRCQIANVSVEGAGRLLDIDTATGGASAIRTTWLWTVHATPRGRGDRRWRLIAIELKASSSDR